MKTVAIIYMCKIPLSEFSLTHCKKNQVCTLQMPKYDKQHPLMFLQHHKFENKNYKSLTGYTDSIV